MLKIECVVDEKSVLSKYGSGFKYSGDSIKISNHIRGLKSIRTTSGYIDFISAWDYETNNKIAKLDDFGQLANYLQFFANYCEFTKEFIKKHNVEKYHLSLIKRMHFEYDDYDGDEINEVTLGYKRPYGNSYVIGDIAEEYVRCSKIVIEIDDEDCWIENREDFLLAIHMRTLEILDLALDELEMPLHFIHNKDKFGFSGDWVVSPIWLRSKKIEVLTNR